MSPLPADPFDPAAVAAWLTQEHVARRPFEPFAARFGVDTLTRAYAVQQAFVDGKQSAGGGGRVGYKIGLTSTAMQAMCGIDTPVAGVVLGDDVRGSGAAVRRALPVRLGLEFEIAVRLGRDLRATDRLPTLGEVEHAVDAVAPAIELVDDRDCDYRSLDVLSLVADNAWNAGIVLGEFRTAWPALTEACGRVLVEDGSVLDEGRGRDVLGDPLTPVAWLAGHLATRGECLRAGEVVMTGSLVTTKFPSRAGRYRFELSGLGAVDLAVLD
jgi:2-keto-4-pentenoate hydratase